MAGALIERLAAELQAATASGVAVPPLSLRHPELTVDDAYRIQRAQELAHLAAGRVLVGRKIGLTSHAMQTQLGISTPDFGYYFEDMVYRDGDVVPASAFIAPRVEPEFAFVLAGDLRGPGVTAKEAGAAVGSVHAALEIIDSRVADWKIALVDTVADNASCGAIVIGPELEGLDPMRLGDIACAFVIDGETLRIGHGRDVYGDPIEALAWLANTLGEYGVALTAGQSVLPGAFVAAHPVVAGTVASADFGDLGSVTITFGE